MSSHKVEVCVVEEVKAHPGADRLDVVRVKGWECVVQKGAFVAGDRCVYIPIDSILSVDLHDRLFPVGSKIKLHNKRVRTAKIRGVVSQGMAVSAKEFAPSAKLGDDVAALLGVVKYEPPAQRVSLGGGKKQPKVHVNPHFHKYTDLENAKNYPEVFAEGEEVVITEKVHGTNFRAGWVPFVAVTWWQKLLSWVRLAPTWVFVYGSRNLQLSSRLRPKTYYDTNVYLEAVKKYDLYTKLPKGCVVYGEVYGAGVQKGYSYGCGEGERKLALFDVMQDGKYVDAMPARALLDAWDLPQVPLLYRGAYLPVLVQALVDGPSVLCPQQPVREGVVVRPASEGMAACGRKILKHISAAYLLSKHADEETAHDQVA